VSSGLSRIDAALLPHIAGYLDVHSALQVKLAFVRVYRCALSTINGARS
jgi:hypothetical protein